MKCTFCGWNMDNETKCPICGTEIKPEDVVKAAEETKATQVEQVEPIKFDTPAESAFDTATIDPIPEESTRIADYNPADYGIIDPNAPEEEPVENEGKAFAAIPLYDEPVTENEEDYYYYSQKKKKGKRNKKKKLIITLLCILIPLLILGIAAAIIVPIIREKSVSLGMDMPGDVCSYIAENITNNIRQIEGTVKKIKAYRDLTGMTLDVPSVSRAIKDMYKGKAETLPTPDLIISEVCRFYNISEDTIRSTQKNKGTAEARQIAMFLIRSMTNLSLPDVGKEFNRDHTTVMHGVNKIEELLKDKTNPLNDVIRDIKANINNKL